MRKVKSILISQPKPETGRSPYLDVADKYNIKVDFRKFIQIEGVPGKDFRKEKINIADYTAVIFTSRNSVDHFFRICEELRVKVSPELRYFCTSESIGLYLQKYIQYRKRKVFYGSGREEDLVDVLKKHKKEKILFPCADIHSGGLLPFLEEGKYDYGVARIYRVVSSNLSDLEKLTYDAIIFFSPLGVKSLFENFPNFKQNNTRIGAFGSTTAQAIKDAGLRLDIQAPSPEAPSMIMALENYLKKSNK